MQFNMQNKLAVCMVTGLLLLIFTCNAHGMTELEKAYKERMKYLQTEAFINCSKEDLAEKFRVSAEKMERMCEKYNREVSDPYYKQDCNQHKEKKQKSSKEYDDAQKKREDILKEIYDIKIKLIEKFGKLPKWWEKYEQDLIKKAFCNKEDQ